MRACVDRYGGLVYSIARRMLPREEIEDAVQDVFVTLWQTAGRFEAEQGGETTWVATLARRRCIDRVRRRKSRPAGDRLDDVPEASFSVPMSLDINDEAAAARRAMAELTSDQRQVLALAIDQGLTYPQIADQLSMPVGTVKTHARRGMIRLRELLGVSIANGGSI
jgi:RNA polymerase sigma-70 factor, ECF subfamily